MNFQIFDGGVDYLIVIKEGEIIKDVVSGGATLDILLNTTKRLIKDKKDNNKITIEFPPTTIIINSIFSPFNAPLKLRGIHNQHFFIEEFVEKF